MTRAELPYYNASIHGSGAEGVANYANTLVNNLLMPFFLVSLYALALFVWSKSDYKMGGGVFFISLVFFLLAMIAQTFTLFSQFVIFAFAIGMIVGIVMHFAEG